MFFVSCLWLGSAVLYAVLCVSSFRLAARLAQSRLGVGQSPLFDVAPVSLVGGAYWMPRASALLAPWFICYCLLVATTALAGVEVASNCIEVFEGPAQAAGMKSGDRVVSVDGQPTHDFDAIRRSIAGAGEHHRFQVDRAQQRLDFDVAADAQGRVHIGSKLESQSTSATEALAEAWRLLTVLPKAALSPLTGNHQELVGPVAIVRQAGGASPVSVYRFLGMHLGLVAALGALTILGLFLIELWSGYTTQRRFNARPAGAPHREAYEQHWRRLQGTLVWLGPLWLTSVLVGAPSIRMHALSQASALVAKVLELDFAVVMYLVAARVLGSKWRWLWAFLGAIGLLNLLVASWLFFAARRRCRRATVLAR